MSVSVWNLYYDSGCNLCHESKLRFEIWAEKKGQPLHATPLQSLEAADKGYGFEQMVLEADRVYTAEDAWLKLMEIAPWYLAWVRLLASIPFIRPMLKWGYRLVARYRIKWFGARACAIPPKP